MKMSLLIPTIAVLASASLASAQGQVIQQPDAASQFERSQGTGDSSLPNRADATTGYGAVVVRPAAPVVREILIAPEPMTMENGFPVVRPSESLSTRPGDASN